jgi:hypothetical protein
MIALSPLSPVDAAAVISPPPLLSRHFTPFRFGYFFAIIDAPLRHAAIFRCLRLLFSAFMPRFFDSLLCHYCFRHAIAIFRVFAFARCH